MNLISKNGTSDLEKDLELVASEIKNELCIAERELEQEHAQLKLLIGDSHPALTEQMKAMEASITRLYQGLEKATMYLQLAQGESYILRQQINQSTPEEPQPLYTS